MAEAKQAGAVDEHGAAGYDGRFGEQFDDEVSVPGILWITFALAAVCVLGMVITWGMKGYFAARGEIAQPSPIAEANERRLPEGPLLQADPEGELHALRLEMAQRLGGYGWVDEGAGVVHIPIDEAMNLLVEQAGSIAAAKGAAEEAPAEEATE